METTGQPDPVRVQLGEASLRMMAGVIPGSTLAALRKTVLAQADAFPWQDVNARILEDRVDDADLLQRALRAQRDWVLKGGAQRRRKSLKMRGKSIAAYVLSRAIYFVFYTIAVAVLLVLLKHQWPSVDIYRVLEWLQEALPGVFRRG